MYLIPRFLLKSFTENFASVPYDQFLQFVAEAREENWFPRWGKWNNTSPLELLILGSFQYLGRGWTFDDLEEATAISGEVHRSFFHQFISIGRTVLYPRYVRAPVSADDCATHMVEFSLAGFNGCVGSSDATHISLKKMQL
jgi:hypothetical protein